MTEFCAARYIHFSDGVGTRALFAATDLLGLTDVLFRLLDSARVVVRGPKPATVLRSRKARIDRAASDPFTTHEVLAELHEIGPLIEAINAALSDRRPLGKS